MTYNKPLPSPTPETKPFWDGCKAHQLKVMHCTACDHTYLYPRPYCPKCFSDRTEWRDASGRGTLHTFMVNHRAAPNFDAPYVTAVVQLEEGPRLLTNLVDVEQDQHALKIDMPVEVVFDDVTDEITLPKFRPVPAS